MQFSFVGGATERPRGPQWASLGRRMFGPSVRCAVANWSVAFRGVLSRLHQLIDRPDHVTSLSTDVTMTLHSNVTNKQSKRLTEPCRANYANKPNNGVTVVLTVVLVDENETETHLSRFNHCSTALESSQPEVGHGHVAPIHFRCNLERTAALVGQIESKSRLGEVGAS